MFPFAGDPTVNPYLWIDAFKKMIDLKPNIVIPGHGHIGSVNDLKKGQHKIEEMINAVEKMYRQKVSKNYKNGSDFLPDFAQDASKQWLSMTIEAFMRIVEEKFRKLDEATKLNNA